MIGTAFAFTWLLYFFWFILIKLVRKDKLIAEGISATSEKRSQSNFEWSHWLFSVMYMQSIQVLSIRNIILQLLVAL